jgi:hypothetical protein
VDEPSDGGEEDGEEVLLHAEWQPPLCTLVAGSRPAAVCRPGDTEPMDDTATRALLRAHVAWGVRPGARVVTHEAVVDAGADAEAVGRFIIARGGQRVDPAPRGQSEAVDAPTRPYWLVPDELLTP